MAEMKGEDMMRRTIAIGAGLLALVALALLPSTASAQYVPPTTQVTVSPTSEVPPPTTEAPTTTTEAPTTTVEETTTTQVAGVSTTVATTQPAPEVQGDVVSRPLPRTGNDISGTAIFGGALTVLGVALALGARKRRNSFDGA